MTKYRVEQQAYCSIIVEAEDEDKAFELGKRVFRELNWIPVPDESLTAIAGKDAIDSADVYLDDGEPTVDEADD